MYVIATLNKNNKRPIYSLHKHYIKKARSKKVTQKLLIVPIFHTGMIQAN